ncbi:MAG: glutamate 5-kinase, partial [Alphaproteobacteria bacterium]|nr:glutamate 5-kinase [Alphaproteobacteria bacterium]
EIEAMAGAASSDVGSGGMVTKVMAARVAMDAGCSMVIASGATLAPLKAIEDDKRCTWFIAPATPAAARKRWIAGTLKPAGTIVVDAGAAAALGQGKSLLPAGVKSVEGNFERGDCIAVKDMSGKELGRGLIAYGAHDARQICGRKSGEIATILGYRGRDEMIHRDDLALTRA